MRLPEGSLSRTIIAFECLYLAKLNLTSLLLFIALEVDFFYLHYKNKFTFLLSTYKLSTYVILHGLDQVSS
jgi:hypothetical protein